MNQGLVNDIVAITSAVSALAALIAACQAFVAKRRIKDVHKEVHEVIKNGNYNGT